MCHSCLTKHSRLYLDVITCVHIFVLCSKMPPLETIHWPQITLLSGAETLLIQELTGPISIPNLHTFCRELFGICRTLQNTVRNLHPNSNTEDMTDSCIKLC